MKSANFRTFTISLSFLIFFHSACLADEIKTSLTISKRMQHLVKTHAAFILKWANSPLICNSVIEHNKKNISMEKIKIIDKAWIAGKQTELIKSLQENDAGRFLRSKVEHSLVYTEAFLCGNKGAVVGLFPKTTDYWQGDEDKFIESYGNGKGRIFYGPLSFDESTQTYAVQISVPVNDWNTTIGVLIVGIKNIKE